MSEEEGKNASPSSSGSRSAGAPPYGNAVNPPVSPNSGGSAKYRSLAIEGIRAPPELRQHDKHQRRDDPWTPRKLENRELPKDTKSREQIQLADSWAHQLELCYTPKFYPLARTRVTLKNQDLQTITKNIAKSFYAMSCQAKYCNTPVSAYLLSWENDEMQVSLWLTEENEIMVEVQRRRGDAISFHKYAQFILDAAEGKFDEEMFEDQQCIDIKYLKEAGIVLRQQYPSASGEEYTSIISTLETVHSLLEDDRIDARIMGMQSLAVLADPRKTGVATSVHIGRVVLLGMGPNHDGAKHFGEIRDFLIKVIQNRDIGEGGIHSYDEYEESDKPVEMQDVVSIMLSLALDVLNYVLEVVNANLQELCEEPGNQEESASAIACHFLDYAQDLSGRKFFSTLVHEIDEAKQKPHLACRSVTCVRLLYEASGTVLQEAMKSKVVLSAKNAYEYGKSNHARLEKESSRVLEQLQAM